MKRTFPQVALATVLAAAAMAPAALSQDAAKLSDTVTKTVETHQQTQKKQEEWASEQADLTSRLKAARAQADFFQMKKELEEKEVAALDKGIAELERRMVESVRLNESLIDTLDAVVVRLENFVNRDLPFLMEERRARIAGLKESLARPDFTGAEKLRRVLEALQVEANYGSVAEVYQEKIMVNDEEVHADMVRIGRVSVYWLTPDGERVGEYDRGQSKWVELDHKYAHTINVTREMALRLRSVEVVSLPLGRIQP
ncbi:MAG TPA: DUF3450 domain-containing protein [Candidatus Krumholzibacteria bacterium]|nr:DUF3450 domain-containing protein [Candidatus Krumholzibacteria bacterium]